MLSRILSSVRFPRRNLSRALPPVALSRPSSSAGLPDTEPLGLSPEEGGGYYSVSSGEQMNGRYTVIRKLGWGHYSSVWLAKDDISNHFVALKIQSIHLQSLVDSQILESEAALLDRIVAVTSDHPGKSHVVQLLDKFSLAGPHGVHTCLIFSVLGPTLPALYSTLGTRKLPYDSVKRLVKQLLQALAFLHDECKIIHTDLKPSNIALDVDNIEDAIQSHLSQEKVQPEYTASASNRGDELPPETLDLHIPTHAIPELSIRLLDFGNANFIEKKRTDNIQPYNLRAPEVFIQAGWGPSVDIWSVGCLVFEMITGMILFRPRAGKVWSEDIDMLLQMRDILNEQFPKALLVNGKRTDELFDDQGNLKGGHGTVAVRLHHIFNHLKIQPQDRDELEHFIKSMLRLHPGDRSSANVLLRHPWFSSRG